MGCHSQKRIRTGCLAGAGVLIFMAFLPVIIMLVAEALFVLAAIIE